MRLAIRDELAAGCAHRFGYRAFCYLCYRLSYVGLITVTTNDPPTQATSYPSLPTVEVLTHRGAHRFLSRSETSQPRSVASPFISLSPSPELPPTNSQPSGSQGFFGLSETSSRGLKCQRAMVKAWYAMQLCNSMRDVNGRRLAGTEGAKRFVAGTE